MKMIIINNIKVYNVPNNNSIQHERENLITKCHQCRPRSFDIVTLDKIDLNQIIVQISGSFENPHMTQWVDDY